jgi:hypothetical protein
MFRWYRNAKICYAYLRDVSGSIVEDGKLSFDIKKSRWFKRAWTLQELLAPKALIFYSYEWAEIGSIDMEHLKSVLSEVTRIDEEYLTPGKNKRLQDASISKRMSWAAKREATREEDIAYSLFGIFDVQMPLLYGEGQQKAFRRLQEEIMKYSDDHTLFAWGIPGGGLRDPETKNSYDLLRRQLADRDKWSREDVNYSFTLSAAIK